MARKSLIPRCREKPLRRDRKSTRLNSSHGYISYAVFCLKKKKKKQPHISILNTHSLIPRQTDRHRSSIPAALSTTEAHPPNTQAPQSPPAPYATSNSRRQ